MKSMSRTLLLIVFAFSMFSLFSCKKILDKLKKDPIAVVDGCNIKTIVQYDTPLSDPRTIDFSYNMHGQPVSAINDRPGTGAPNLYFRYDAKKRLTDFIGLYTNGEYEYWYRYEYDHHNRVIRDTQWVFGTFGANPDPSSYFIRVSTYTYDANHRVASRSTIEIQPDVYDLGTTTFIYDAAGNLGGGAYDDKLNFRRTNKVWMFVERNYSINNNPAAVSYNGTSLPTEFNTATNFSFLGFAMNKSTIEYFCD